MACMCAGVDDEADDAAAGVQKGADDKARTLYVYIYIYVCVCMYMYRYICSCIIYIYIYYIIYHALYRHAPYMYVYMLHR